MSAPPNIIKDFNNKINFTNVSGSIPNDIYKYFYLFPKPFDELFGENVITTFYSTKYLFNKLDNFYSMMINLIEINKEKFNKDVSRNNYKFNKSNFIFFGLFTKDYNNDFNNLFNLSRESISSKVLSKINKDEKDFISKFQKIDGVFNCLSNKNKPFFLNLFDRNYNGNDKNFFMELFEEYNDIRRQILSVADLKGNAGILSLEPFIKYDIDDNNDNNNNSKVVSNNNENNFSNSLFFNSNKSIYQGLSKNVSINEESTNTAIALSHLENAKFELKTTKNQIKKLEKNIVKLNKIKTKLTKKYGSEANKKQNFIEIKNKFNTARNKIKMYKNTIGKLEMNVKIASEKIPKISNSENKDSTDYSLFYKKNLSNINQEYSNNIHELFRKLHENINDIVLFDNRGRDLYSILLTSIKIDYLSLQFFYRFIESVKFKIITDTSIKINSYIYNNIDLYKQNLPLFLSWKEQYVIPEQLLNAPTNSSTHIDEEAFIFQETLKEFFNDWNNKISNIKKQNKEINNRKDKIKDFSKGIKILNEAFKKKSLLNKMGNRV